MSNKYKKLFISPLIIYSVDLILNFLCKDFIFNLKIYIEGNPNLITPIYFIEYFYLFYKICLYNIIHTIISPKLIQ